jgi:hypothetical protein
MVIKVALVNKSITDKLTKNTVILDPAGLSYMKNGFIGAGGASGSIYKLLNSAKPTDKVINHFSKFANQDDLYKNNSDSIACYGFYDDIKIIHAVGPDFRSSKYLQEILCNTEKTDKLFHKIYDDIYREFSNLNNNKLTLRLLPISSGIFINNDLISKIKIFRSLLVNYHKLNDKYKIKPKIYLYDKTDFKIMKFLSELIH